MRQVSLLLTIFIFSSIQLYAQSHDTLWSENWEGDWVSDWYVDAGTWQIGTPTFGPDTTHEGIQCAATVLAGNYGVTVRSRLIRIKKFIVPPSNQNPRLRLWHWFSFTTYDYGYVQIKTEHGVWQNISPQYYGTSCNRWTYPSINLSAFADSLVQIAFYFHSDSPHESHGWYIDDIHILTGNYNFYSNEGFENGLGDWYAERGTWEVGQPTSGPDTSYIGENCLTTILDGDYWDNMSTLYISPPFKVKSESESPALRFWHWYSFTTYDYGQVKLQIASHAEWIDISPQFTSSSSGVWTTFYSDLSEFADSIVQIAFYFYSRDPHLSSGWYIDDLKISGIPIHTKTVLENDLGIEWLEPISKPICGTLKEQPITIQVENKGKRAVSNFEVGYSIDRGVNYFYETVYKTIDPGSSLDYTFRRKADMAEADSFNCQAKVYIQYDINDTNDIVLQKVENDRLIFDIESTDTECHAATGAVKISEISGRPGPFGMYWTSGDTGMVAENLKSGIYFVTVSDAQGCKWTKSFTINDIGAPEVSKAASLIKNISCYGLNDGIILIYPTGGVQPYTFLWSNGETSQEIDSLSKGDYDLTITDAEGCSKTHSFLIEEPSALKVRSSSTDAACGELDGTATLIVNGGTKPYSYTWDSGHSSNTVSGLPGGLYTAIVTDKNGCIDSAKISINETDAPGIIVTSINPATCGLSDGGINISMADLDYQYNYSWSDGSTSEDNQDLSVGIYSITVSYQDGSCSSSQIIEIPVKIPDPGSICMITVDSITDGIIVVLNNPVKPEAISSFNIYQLSKSGTYQYLNTSDPAVTNTTLDVASSTEITSYRYRVTQMDYCGNESEPGPYHETMHTVVTPDFSLTRANLLWNSYKGVDYDFFQIYRYSGSMGLEIIDTVPKITDKDFYTYTDLNPPLNDTVYYVIVIELPEPCNSTKKAGSHNTIRSNRSKKLNFGNTWVDNPASLRHLIIYPNPNNGSFTLSLEMTRMQDMDLRIFDAQGKLIKNYQYTDVKGRFEETIWMPGLKAGLYHLQLLLNDGVMSKSFVVE